MKRSSSFIKSCRLFLFILSVSLMLTACGETTSTGDSNPTVPAANNSVIQAASPGVAAGRPVTQPKVIRVVNDGIRSNITFTDIPAMNTGVPTFLFFDAEGCIYCAQMQPLIDKFKQEYSAKVQFGDLDFFGKQNQTLVQEYRIPGHPGFVLLDAQGKLVQRWIGVTPSENIETAFKTVVD